MSYEFHSVNQIAIVLLLLVIATKRDTIDNEVMEAICLACILSLLVKEVQSGQDEVPLPAIKKDADTSEPGGILETADEELEFTDDMEEEQAMDETPGHRSVEREINRPSMPHSGIPATRRPLDAYSIIPGTETPRHQTVAWKPMPPKSIVPVKQASSNEHSLSIKFAP